MASDTVRKRNISGEDLEVTIYDLDHPTGYVAVKDGDEVDLPRYFPWHTKDAPAEIVYGPSKWADVKPVKPPLGSPVTKSESE